MPKGLQVMGDIIISTHVTDYINLATKTSSAFLKQNMSIYNFNDDKLSYYSILLTPKVLAYGYLRSATDIFCSSYFLE